MDAIHYVDELLELVPKRKQKMANRYADEIKWMDDKLNETRKVIANAPVVIPYDNGGGQTGIRANPAYSEYERLLKTWDKTMRSLIDLIPASALSDIERASGDSPIEKAQRKFSVIKRTA